MAVGQSYHLTYQQVDGSAPARIDHPRKDWDKRTYVVWEPRLGMSTIWPDQLEDHSFGFGAFGGTLGWRWDRLNGVTAKAHSIFGGWVGGGYVPKPPQHTCSRWYVSVAAGIRGDEALQGLGAILLTVGLTIHTEGLVPDRSVPVTISPVRLGRSGYGLGMAGTF